MSERRPKSGTEPTENVDKIKWFVILGKGQFKVKVKIEVSMHNHIIPPNCWYHYLSWATNQSMRNCVLEVVPLKAWRMDR
jgi:hypothetical protein